MINNWNDIPSSEKIYLYGAGEGGKRSKEAIELHRKDCFVVGFIDDAKVGLFEQKPIFALDDLPQDALVLVSSAYWHFISEKLARTTLSWQVLSTSLFYDYLLFNADDLQRRNSDFDAVKAILASEDDVELYSCVVESRSRDNAIFALTDIYNTRFAASTEYLDFINKDAIRATVEGGVLDGKNSLDFINAFGDDSVVYGFEPLWGKGGHRAILSEGDNFIVERKALWHKKENLFFASNATSTESSKISDNSVGELVEAVSIDEYVLDNKIEKVDFIKLDVEGAEINVLQGASDTIVRDRPQMAISIYHSKDDLTTIPIYLASICKDYIFKLGHYSKTYWDTVLYAIPREKFIR
jgi:FkbM family methyltransferase